jgi:hypothetical protein
MAQAALAIFRRDIVAIFKITPRNEHVQEHNVFDDAFHADSDFVSDVTSISGCQSRRLSGASTFG